MTQNRFKEVHDISYNLITIQEQLFEIKFEKYGTFPHFTGVFSFLVCGCGLNRISTVAESGSFLVAP